jgi:predicted DNA-binding transcriptional regulator YafY
MSYHRGLLNVLKIMGWLRPPGMTPVQLAQRLDMSTRSVYRYLETLQEAGFDLERDGNRYVLKMTPHLRPEAVFSSSEMDLLQNLTQGLPEQHPLRTHLLTKLQQSLPRQEAAWRVAAALSAQHIEKLQEAIRRSKQVVLKNYHSLQNDSVRDRLVEPIEPAADWIYLQAYEIDSGKTKSFKIARIGEVLITDHHQCYQKHHTHEEADPFGMSGGVSREVVMRLSPRAAHLLQEEHPRAQEWLDLLNNKPESGSLYKGPVKGFEGIGRFLLSLPGEFEVIEPPELTAYLQEQNQRFHFLEADEPE